MRASKPSRPPNPANTAQTIPTHTGKFTCPDTHALDAAATETECTALNDVPTCDDDDIDTCCNPRAMCETLDCGLGSVAPLHPVVRSLSGLSSTFSTTLKT